MGTFASLSISFLVRQRNSSLNDCTNIDRILNSSSASKNKAPNSGDAFTTVFTIFWIGSAVITVNATLLGGKM